MIAIIDKRVSATIKNNLKKYAEVIEFQTDNITYNSISGHPDIFFTKVDKNLYIPLNLPESYVKILEEHKISYNIVNQKVGIKYPQSAILNIATNEKYIFHNEKITPKEIIENNKEKKFISVKQGYTRCSLIPLPDLYITSDMGVYNQLLNNNLKVIYVTNENIIIEDYDKGFIGGTTGIIGNIIFFTGSLKHYSWGEKLRKYIEQQNFEIIELSNEKLLDCGTIIFI
ncbi:MAG TPA: hypothetical protein PK887_06790 [Ignavibacteriales bacterium]|nr:hypothetical protein [Ignavibacteriales bacterium]